MLKTPKVRAENSEGYKIAKIATVPKTPIAYLHQNKLLYYTNQVKKLTMLKKRAENLDTMARGFVLPQNSKSKYKAQKGSINEVFCFGGEKGAQGPKVSNWVFLVCI